MFHIVFSADENYIPYTAVLMTSIVQNTDTKQTFEEICLTKTLSAEFGEAYASVQNLDFASLDEETKNEGYVFHILSDAISELMRQNLAQLQEALNQSYPCQIITHIMSQSDFVKFPKSGAAHSNFLPYYRLKTSCFLDEDVSRFLYLDSDMLVLFDIRELFAIDLSDKVAAVVGDCGTKRRKIKFVDSGKKQIHYFDENYFNSGFLLINRTEYKKQNIEEKCENLASSCTYITAADQDLLNVVFPISMLLKLPVAFNFQTKNFCYTICNNESRKYLLNYTREEFTKSFKNPKILHYGEKPWKYLKSYLDSKGKNISEIWWNYANSTPVFGQTLLENKQNNKDYLVQAMLGFRVLEYSKTLFGILKIRSLILNPEVSSKTLEQVHKIPDEIFGLCLILGEMIFFANKRNRSALSVFFKAKKVKRAFEIYHLANFKV